VLCISGRGAAALFSGETGGHRWQRVPPTEKRGRVQTSTITVAVLAEPRQLDVVLRPEDVDIETMRGSGAGGQHRNKTETGVRLIHKPTGFTVTATERRSQLQNRGAALERLRAAFVKMSYVPEKRIATKPSRGSKRRRLEGKRINSEKKQGRRGDW
jgi:peptide chain release factor 1